MATPKLVNFGFIKAVRIGFYTMDPYSLKARMLLHTLKGKEIKEVNPNLQFDMEVFKKPAMPYISVTLVDDRIINYDARNTSIKKLCDSLNLTCLELAQAGFVSEYEKLIEDEIDQGED